MLHKNFKEKNFKSPFVVSYPKFLCCQKMELGSLGVLIDPFLARILIRLSYYPFIHIHILAQESLPFHEPPTNLEILFMHCLNIKNGDHHSVNTFTIPYFLGHIQPYKTP